MIKIVKEMDRKNLEDVKKLLSSQQVGALSTEYEGQPYASLIAYATSEDLKSILFATERSTRKYMNMSVNPKAAVLVDNRAKRMDVDAAMAVTAMGSVEEVKGEDWKNLSETYLSKQPAFAGFLESAALMRLRVENYVVVKGLKRIDVIDMH